MTKNTTPPPALIAYTFRLRFTGTPPSGLWEATEELQQRSFPSQPEQLEASSDWFLHVTAEATVEDLAKHRTLVREVGHRYGATYDGGEARGASDAIVSELADQEEQAKREDAEHTLGAHAPTFTRLEAEAILRGLTGQRSKAAKSATYKLRALDHADDR